MTVVQVAFAASVVTYVLGGSVSLFMPSLTSFTLVRFVAAVNAISSWNTAYVWAMEYTGPRRRTAVSTGLVVAYALAMASMSLIALLCRSELQMGLATTLPFLLLLSYWSLSLPSASL